MYTWIAYAKYLIFSKIIYFKLINLYSLYYLYDWLFKNVIE